MSALYLGTGEREKRLVRAIDENLTENLKVKILLDYCRGTRVVDGESSCTVLGKLLADRKVPSSFHLALSQILKGVHCMNLNIQRSCRVSLYHTPLLRGAWKALMPQRYNETLGLQHTKIFVFDDSVILSGANLSSDYFTNRQDR